MGHVALALLFKKKKNHPQALPENSSDAKMDWLETHCHPAFYQCFTTNLSPFFLFLFYCGGCCFPVTHCYQKWLHFSAKRNVEESFRMKGKIRKASYSIKLKCRSSRGRRPFAFMQFAVLIRQERCFYSSPGPAYQFVSELGAQEESLNYTPNALLLLAHCYMPSE